MTLEEFLKEGNKMCLMGSFLSFPEDQTEFANDIDLVFFVHEDLLDLKENEIRRFLANYYPHINDRWYPINIHRKDRPFKLDDIPQDDPWLDGYFLAGKFFNDSSFLDDHYKKLFGKDYLVEVWRRLCKDILRKNNKVRTNKDDRDYLLLIRATERISKDYPTLRKLVLKNWEIYHSFKFSWQHQRIRKYASITNNEKVAEAAKNIYKSGSEILGIK